MEEATRNRYITCNIQWRKILKMSARQYNKPDI